MEPISISRATESLTPEQCAALSEGLTDAQRIKSIKRQLRQSGKHAEADTIKLWEMANKVCDILHAETAKADNARPVITALTITHPEAARLLLQGDCCSHGIDLVNPGAKKAFRPYAAPAGHLHGPHVHPVFRELLNDTGTPLSAEYADAAKEAYRLYAKTRRGAKSVTPLTPAATNGSSGFLPYESPHTCTTSCNHTHHIPAATHYGGNCPHTHHDACKHLPAAELKGEIHLRGNRKLWLGAGIAAAVLGAYALHEYGKKETPGRAI